MSHTTHNPYWAVDMHRRYEEADGAFQNTRKAIKALERLSNLLALRRFEGLRDAYSGVVMPLEEIRIYLNHWVPSESDLAAIRAQNEADGVPMPEVPDAL